MFTSRYTARPNIRMKQNAPSGPAESTQFDARDFANKLKNASPADQENMIASLRTEQDMRDVYAGLIMDQADEPLKNRVFQAIQSKKNVEQTPQGGARVLNESQKKVQQETVSADEKQRILASFANSSNSGEREVANQAIASKENFETKTEQVKSKTRVKTATARAETPFQDQAIDARLNNGELSSDSMIQLLADLDGMSGVEQQNRGALRRALFGGTEQKESVGEQQLMYILRGKSRAELDDIYRRVTGNQSGNLPWNPTLDSRKMQSGDMTIRSRFDIDQRDRARIENFQSALISEANVMADISAILLNDPSARAGLMAVVEPGGKERFNALLRDPQKSAEFVQTLANSEIIKRDPSMWDTILGTLLKVGIMIPVSVFSKGTIGGYIEQGTLDAKKTGGVQGNLGNLTAKAGIGESGSAAASVDIAGVRLEGNWNDPQMRMANRLAYVTESADPKTASRELVNKIDGESKDQKNSDTIRDISEQYLRAQDQLLALPDSEGRKNAVAQNTMSYLARVEQARGAQLKGVFAAATTAGWLLGLSGSITDRSGNFDKINTGAARIEGEALGARKLSGAEEQQFLTQAGVQSVDGGYTFPDGSELFPGNGERVIFHFEEIVTDRGTTLTVRGEVVPRASAAKSEVTTTRIGRKNQDTVDALVAPNTEKVSNLVKSLRATQGKNMGRLETLIADEQYTDAEKLMESILRTSKDKIATDMLTHMKGLSGDQKKVFFDDILRLTSGSNTSRKLADELNRGKDVQPQVEKLYKDGLAQQFGEIYGVSGDVIMAQFQKMKSSIQGSPRSLGSAFTGGFTGLVSYSQLDGAGNNILKRADKVDSARAQMIGTPASVTDSALLKGTQDQFKSRMTNQDIEAYRQSIIGMYPELEASLDSVAIKNMVVDGTIPASLQKLGYTVKTPPKVSSYLSFEKYAECFNIGFVLEPLVLEKTENIPGVAAPEGGYTQGSVVGVPQGHILNFGLGIGGQWGSNTPDKKPPEEKPPTTNPGDGGGTPQPKPPIEPPVKPPVEPPVRPPVEPPKPPVEPPVTPPPTPNVPNPGPGSAPITNPGVNQISSPNIPAPVTPGAPGGGVNVPTPVPIAPAPTIPGTIPGGTPPAPITGGR